MMTSRRFATIRIFRLTAGRVSISPTLSPKKYRNRLFMCNIHEHAVLTDILEPSGSSFIGKHGDDFMPTNDLAWVGFSVEIGPEGGVYILDWHDTDVCGNAVNFPNSGRVYRIMPKGAKGDCAAQSESDVGCSVGSTADAFERLVRSPVAYCCYRSRAAAGSLDKSLVHSQLEDLFQSARDHAEAASRTVGFAGHRGLGSQSLDSAVGHEDEYVRGWAIQFLCDASTVNAFQDASKAGRSGRPSIDRILASLCFDGEKRTDRRSYVFIWHQRFSGCRSRIAGRSSKDSRHTVKTSTITTCRGCTGSVWNRWCRIILRKRCGLAVAGQDPGAPGIRRSSDGHGRRRR